MADCATPAKAPSRTCDPYVRPVFLLESGTLSETSAEEAPRYSRLREVPKWLRDDYVAERSSFLFRGADTAAIEVHLPPEGAATALRGVGVLICPGGGYEHLAPHEAVPPALWLCQLGAVAFVLRYRVLPHHEWPAPREDLYAALARLRDAEFAAKWGYDSERLAVLGFSAGAHLAGQAFGSPGVFALVLVYPALEDCGDVPTATAVETVAAQNSGVVPEGLSQVYLVASTNDRMLPPSEHADLLDARFRELGVACKYQRSKLGEHGFGVRKKWTRPCAAFLREACARSQRETSSPSLDAEHPVVVEQADKVADLLLQLNLSQDVSSSRPLSQGVQPDHAASCGAAVVRATVD
mmetsp:Transcript_14561/g.31564  ORF Transcript_14561/g.31564 Transcript_14561/m.31564 type:complete len:353 (-) Transcript_14561:226-1284(-)